MHNLLEKLALLKGYIGNTPIYNLSPEKRLFAKIEYHQLGGSIKMRSAFKVMEEAIKSGIVNQDTVIIESTSGNFGIALALICNKLNLKFIPVIDPCISTGKRKKLTLLCEEIVEVTQKDETGNYLLSRMKYIKKYLKENKNSFQPNQYSNKNCYLAHKTLVSEVKDQVKHIDYIFVAVSSGGTITGIAKTIRDYYKNIKVVAVDIEGSLIFSDQAKPRNLPGIGASKRSDFISRSEIDEIMMLNENQIREGCSKLFNETSILAGASSGAVYYAAEKKIKNFNKKKSCLIIIPDSGDEYLDLIDYKRLKEI